MEVMEKEIIEVLRVVFKVFESVYVIIDKDNFKDYVGFFVFMFDCFYDIIFLGVIMGLVWM